MENRTRFKLANSIINWKKNLSGSCSMTADNIEELESHLLDEIDSLKLKGLTEEEAFLIAIKRIGTKELLVSEFSKLSVFNTIVLKCMPFLKGILFYLCLMPLISILGKSSILAKEYFNVGLGITNIVSVLIFMLILSTIAYAFYRNIKNGKPMLKLFNNIPVLVGGVIILKTMDFLSNILALRQIPMEDFGWAMKGIGLFEICFIILILISSLLFYIKSIQIHKMKIA